MTAVLRSSDERVSLRIDVRSVVVCLGLMLVAALGGAALLATGDYPVPVPDVLRALVGQADPGTAFIVTTLRLPRLVTAVLVGAALAVSGAMLQGLTRNPLGSPDLIGFTVGSATGALLVILLARGSMAEVAAGAVVGGLATAVVVYALAYRGGASGGRIVLVGIGVSSLLLAVNHYLITRAVLHDAIAAQSWLTGSLNGRGWDHVWAVGAALVLLLPIALHHGRHLAMLGMGDDAARGLGVPVERSRLVMVVVSVALASVAVAAAGPIPFLALAAPQLARRLTRTSGAGLLPAAFMGAALLVVADLATQRLFAPTPLPVGIATGVIGGAYLAWLLTHEWRR